MGQRNLQLKFAIMDKFGFQMVVAKAIGMKENKLSRIVSGRDKPTREQQDRLCALLGMSPKELFGKEKGL